MQALFQLPISTLDALPPGQTTAIITITANTLQLGISERLSSLIQAVAVILIALVIGCIFCWQLTLVTASGLIAIATWYHFITPLVVHRHMEVQKIEREAAGAANEAFTSMRMIAACSAESKVIDKYDKLVESIRTAGQRSSPIVAVQHSPGTLLLTHLKQR